MELAVELLTNLLAEKKVEVTIPGLELSAAELVEKTSYQILCRIREILSDDNLDDVECFRRIEDIVLAMENAGVSCGSRHDFG